MEAYLQRTKKISDNAAVIHASAAPIPKDANVLLPLHMNATLHGQSRLLVEVH